RAFLEDGQRNRVFAYGVGDAVAGGRLERIEPDRVVLSRGGETLEVLLRDPTKPKPPAPPAGAAAGAPPSPAFPRGGPPAAGFPGGRPAGRCRPAGGHAVTGARRTGVRPDRPARAPAARAVESPAHADRHTPAAPGPVLRPARRARCAVSAGSGSRGRRERESVTPMARLVVTLLAVTLAAGCATSRPTRKEAPSAPACPARTGTSVH